MSLTDSPTAAASGVARPTPSDADAAGPRQDAAHGRRNIAMELTKARLNALVLVTTAVGFLLGEPRSIDWGRLGWTLLGTACAAASAAMLNQLLEHRRDALMHRTRERPIPSGRVRRLPVFVGGVLLAYAGTAILALAVNMPSAALALVNVLLYALVYTPLKPLTTMNTLVGAVTGAIPPMLGWAAATGGLESGAWILGAILFVWQLPHFLALAWIYREDYRRGGHSMLPVVDPSGELTARTMVGTSLLLVPLGFALTVMGAVGWIAAFANVPLALAMAYLSIRFYADRSDRRARAVFLASILYLPLALAVMTLDRGPVDAESWLRGGREPFAVPMPVEP